MSKEKENLLSKSLLSKFKNYLDKEFIPRFQTLKALGYVFKTQEHYEFSTEGFFFPHSYYIYVHRENINRKVFFIWYFEDSTFNVEFSNLFNGYTGLDSRFFFSEYLEFKKVPLLGKKLSPSEGFENFKKIFQSFKNTLIHFLTHDKELRDILSDPLKWRNPLISNKPRIKIKDFENFMDEYLIPEPEEFKSIGLLFKRKEIDVKKSPLTKYKCYPYEYVYEHQKSNINFKIRVHPEFFFVLYDYLLCSVTIMRSETDKVSSDSFWLGDYLRFKKKPELKRWLKLEKRQNREVHEHFQSFFAFINEMLIKDQGLIDIIQGKRWELVPNYLMEQYY